MIPKNKRLLYSILAASAFVVLSFSINYQPQSDFVSYIADPQKVNIQLYWKYDSGKRFKSLLQLKQQIDKKKKHLIFAMNGGMYKADGSPLGLYIENFRELTAVNKNNGEGNFYLKPNAVFSLDKNNIASINNTNFFINDSTIKYATQSGPMLLINAAINTAFKQGSLNINIRNGVGILPGNKVLFAMSKDKINIYDFANFFKEAGCTSALYLDGFVSRTYYPGKNWIQTDGDFGVMIAVTAK